MMGSVCGTERDEEGRAGNKYCQTRPGTQLVFTHPHVLFLGARFIADFFIYLYFSLQV